MEPEGKSIEPFMRSRSFLLRKGCKGCGRTSSAPAPLLLWLVELFFCCILFYLMNTHQGLQNFIYSRRKRRLMLIKIRTCIYDIFYKIMHIIIIIIILIIVLIFYFNSNIFTLFIYLFIFLHFAYVAFHEASKIGPQSAGR